MSYERIILDIEATDLLEPMTDFTKRPLQRKPDAKIWCITVRCIDTNDNITFIPQEILDDIDKGMYKSTPEVEEEFSKLKIAPLKKESFDRLFLKTKEFVGHNIIKYDLPVLKLFGLLDYQIGYPYYEELDNKGLTETKINDTVLTITDTLIWSKLLNADRYGGHSLASWGKQNNNEKIDHSDFSQFSKDMVVYCVQDTSVNLDVYESEQLEKDGYLGWEKPYAMEAKLADLVLKQELFGFHYDLDLSHNNKIELDRLLKERYETVTPNIPPKPLNIGETKQWTPPKIKFSKTSNTVSSHMKKFLEKIGAEYNPLNQSYTFEGKTYDLYYDGCVKDKLPADITDLSHLKGYLISLGWVPSQWNIRDLTRDSKKKLLTEEKFLATVERYVKETFEGPFKALRLQEIDLDEDTTEEELREFLVSQYKPKKPKPIRVATTPPFRVGATKDLCPNLEKLSEDGVIPFVTHMVEYFTYQHRRNSIAGGIDDDTGEPSKGFESYVRADGRISTGVDSNATNTSRMAHKVVCNIPRVSSLYGGNMRALFGSGPDFFQLGYDYASLEARIEGSYVFSYQGGPELAHDLLLEKPNDIHTKTAKKLGIERDDAKSINYALLYGAAANKLKKMLGLTDKEAEEMYDAYWDALPALRDLKNKVEKYWEANGQQYVLAMDGRRLMARSKHSLLNLLFQSAGSLAMKYGIILTAQKLELENSLGNILNDTHEENINKVNQMIIYHDEAQYAIPKSWYKPIFFESKEEAEEYKVNNNMCTPVHFSDKKQQYYLDGENHLSELVLQSVEEVVKLLSVKVDLGIEWSVGLNWRDTH